VNVLYQIVSKFETIEFAFESTKAKQTKEDTALHSETPSIGALFYVNSPGITFVIFALLDWL
jgi:hypothetical protein